MTMNPLASAASPEGADSLAAGPNPSAEMPYSRLPGSPATVTTLRGGVAQPTPE
jgi:hypothetical protein